MKVLLPVDISGAGKEYLLERGYEIIHGSGSTPGIMKREIEDCDAILIRTQKLPGDVLAAGNKLKVISRHGVGLDNIDLDTAKELGIAVTYAPESNMNSVAEHAVALMLAIVKNIVVLDRATHSWDFQMRERITSTELSGKTLSLIGLGKIGRLVAAKAHFGFNMRVLGYDPFLSADDVPDYVEIYNDVNDIIQRADILSIHVPLTRDNENFIGKSVFTAMKRDAYFINVSRGELVDEMALCNALTSGQIAGAAIDVLAVEPPNPDNPLLKLDHIIITPHSAALTEEAKDRMGLHAAMGIDDILSGRDAKWRIL